MSRNNRLTTNENATVTDRAKIAAGVNRLVALDALPCDLLECIAETLIKNASPAELDSVSGTHGILKSRIDLTRNQF
jgi:hypothetical protein